MSLPIVSIVTDPNRISWAEVFIDGHKIGGVQEMHIDTAFDQAPIITIKIVCVLETVSKTPQEDPNGAGR